MLIVGKNDLETWCKNHHREELLMEWDYEINRGLKNKFGADISNPSCVMPNSNLNLK